MADGDTDPRTQADFSDQVVANTTDIDPGHQCYKLDALENVSAGQNGTIQLEYWAEFEGENDGKNQSFFACADIVRTITKAPCQVFMLTPSSDLRRASKLHRQRTVLQRHLRHLHRADALQLECSCKHWSLSRTVRGEQRKWRRLVNRGKGRYRRWRSHCGSRAVWCNWVLLLETREERGTAGQGSV